jgi:hypothetical protein
MSPEAKDKERSAPENGKGRWDNGYGIGVQEGIVEGSQAIDGGNLIVVDGEGCGEERKGNGREGNS